MMTTDSPSLLAGLRIFVAEDEVHVLEMIEFMLMDLGCAITDSVSSVGAALDRATATQAQIALLDVNLRGQAIFPVARILRARGIPMLFATGYGGDGIDAEWRGSPFIQKPFAFEQLEASLTQLLTQMAPVPE